MSNSRPIRPMVPALTNEHPQYAVQEAAPFSGLVAVRVPSMEHARLFAAAPAMLEALEKLITGGVWDDNVIQECKAAIAQAKGEA
jgi:hypothetical protein